MEYFGFQRIFLAIVWGVFCILYFGFFLKYKTKRQVKEISTFAKKILFFSEWSYRYFLIVIIGYILLFVGIGEVTKSSQWIIVILGMLFVLDGVVLLCYARLHLRANWTVGWSFLKSEHKLITGGPYKIIRHPIYLAFFLMNAGTALVMLNKYIFVVVLLLLVVVHFKMKSEEKSLILQFGSDYEEYKKKVPGFFPIKF